MLIAREIKNVDFALEVSNGPRDARNFYNLEQQIKLLCLSEKKSHSLYIYISASQLVRSQLMFVNFGCV